MKILMLTHRVPYPPDRGDRIRSYHLLKFLAAHAEVSLACTTTELVSAETHATLGKLCARYQICELPALGRALRAGCSLLSRRSATEGYFWHPQLAQKINQWNAQQPFDAILCYCSGMFPYASLPSLENARLVVDLVDVDSRKWSDCAAHTPPPKRWLHKLESRRVERLEKRVADRANSVLVISDEERKIFESIAPKAPVTVVSNGVDLDYFQPSPNIDPEPHTCCFVGVLNYAPNVDGLEWFCANVWPAVHAAIPDAKFLIVGKSPLPSIRQLPAMPGVELHPDVPDVRPYLRRSSIVVSPLRFARGVQNKVLEAMAMGKAVVASLGSLEGLQAPVRQSLVEAQHTADWTLKLSSLMCDPPRTTRIGASARKCAENYHLWSDCLLPVAESLKLPLLRQSAPGARSKTTCLNQMSPASRVVSQSS